MKRMAWEGGSEGYNKLTPAELKTEDKEDQWTVVLHRKKCFGIFYKSRTKSREERIWLYRKFLKDEW